jgi:hypothetical protein
MHMKWHNDIWCVMVIWTLKKIDMHINKWVLWTNGFFYPIKQKGLKGLRFKGIVFIW